MKSLTTTVRQAASNRTPRHINRGLVLGILRKQQPISRADLARASGLQRSTISLIIEELIADKLVLEGSTGKLPRGRHPTHLQIDPQNAVLALDIHPEQATLAVSDLCGRILETRLVNMTAKERSVTSMVNAVKRILADHKDKAFQGIGVCLPGRTDPITDKPVFAPNLHFPIDNLRKRFAEVTGLRVELSNVANACVLGQVWFGGMEATHDIVVVNVSEGIGTGILANGQLVRGEQGMAGEFGHVQLDPEGPLCGCGSHGCWEMLASNRAALRSYEQASGTQLDSFPALLQLAQGGDAHASEVLHRMAVNLGRGLRVIVAALAPREIVIVGDITSIWHQVGAVIDTSMRKDLLRTATMLRPAYDGTTTRLRGAVALILSSGAFA